jgi:hypothetical protein
MARESPETPPVDAYRIFLVWSFSRWTGRSQEARAALCELRKLAESPMHRRTPRVPNHQAESRGERLARIAAERIAARLDRLTRRAPWLRARRGAEREATT